MVIFSTSAPAACPDVGVAPRTLNAPADQYAQSQGFGLGDDGVLYYDYGSRYGDLGKYRNPYFISNYANALYRDYLVSGCNDGALLRAFLTQAEYLYGSAEIRNGMAVWAYPFPGEAFDLPPGWISGIGQARIAGVLERAFVLTNDAKFDERAKAAMTVFRVAPADGGVATIEGDVTWFEEAADPGGASYKILNGHITALAGILDIYQITGYEEWGDLFDRGVAAVRRDITAFDAGFLSYYSLASPRLRQMAARNDYNATHVHQLIWLYEQVNDPIFLEWASRFRAYEINSDVYSAKGSVDPIGHGPDKAAGYYGRHYWSHSDFPTWLQVDVGAPDHFLGIAVHGGGEASAPRDYSVSARLKGEWQVVARDRGNTDVRRVIKFTYPVQADAFRLDIEADNGNRNVAVQAFMPIRSEAKYAALANECNYYPFFIAPYSEDTWSDIKPRCDGWIVIPVDGAGHLRIKAEGTSESRITIERSDDLSTWAYVADVGHSADISYPAAKYIRLSFKNSLKVISELKIF